jgi:hypothetical protein
MRLCLRRYAGQSIFGVLTVGVDLGLGGRARGIRVFHVCLRALWPVLSLAMLQGRVWGLAWHFGQVVENRGRGRLAEAVTAVKLCAHSNFQRNALSPIRESPASLPEILE